MMKKILLSGLSMMVMGFTAKAQNLNVVDDTLNFAITTELTASTLPLKVFNPNMVPLAVTDIEFFKIYGDAPFTLSDTAFTVQPGDTHTVQISFLPEHNILHQMALVVKTNSGFGHIDVVLNGQGRYSNSYYNTSENKSEAALKTALKARIGQGYNSLGYNTARDNMFMTIDNKKNNGQAASVNTLECIYTGTVITGYSSRSAAQNGNPQFNTEHTFPQGKFNSNEPMKSDIHHLYPTTNTSNSQRGNDPFGIVSNAGWNQGGSKSGGGTFEPRDVQKGATARSMMYFVLRYQDYGNFFQGQEAILRNWHNQYPPTAIDTRRNDDIFSVQGNRNPFTDYPQFAERITSLVTNASPAPVKAMYYSDDTIKLAQGSGTYNYTYVVYNDGNQPLNFSNFSLSDPALSFTQGNLGTVTLAPQTAREVNVTYNASVNYPATLSYDVDINGTTTVNTPIISGRSIGLEELAISNLDIYPNPTQGILNLSVNGGKIEKVWLINSTGVMKPVSVNSSSQVDISKEAVGIYVIVVLSDEGPVFTKRVIRH
jgi:endonuclease I